MTNKYLEKIASTAMVRNALKKGLTGTQAHGEEWALRNKINSSLQKEIPTNGAQEYGRKFFVRNRHTAGGWFGNSNNDLLRGSRGNFGK